MISEEMLKMFERQIKLQMEAVQNAEKLNEQVAKKRPFKDRNSMLFNFERKLGGNEPNYFRQSFITGKRHFSKKDVDELQPIRLNEMMVPKVHYGKYLICRTISKAVCIVGLLVLVEDINGHVEDLSLYNMTNNLNLNTDDLIPIGTILVIKEPYMKYGSIGNNTCIRCDSPSDVIFIDESNTLLKNTKWFMEYTQKQFEQFKVQGNRLFHNEKFELAFRWYCKAFSIEPNSSKIHLNLAAVLLKLERYEEAYKHAKLSNDISPTEKAIYRMAVSAYHIRNWTLALEHYKIMKADLESDLELKNEGINKCETRLKESKTGSYNWFNMLSEANSSTNPRLDYADYKGPVEVSNVEGKGKGLIATRDIKQGELLLVSKAFSISYQSELQNIMIISSNSITKKIDKNTQVLNITNTIQNLKNNPSMGKDVYNLYSGNSNRDNVEIPFGCIDTGRIEQICAFNTFAPVDMETIIGVESEMLENIADSGCGLWLLPSYINHSCYNNANRTFYGDFMTVHSLRSIKKGDEITVTYFANVGPLKYRQEVCNHYNFICKCVLCEMDRNDDQYEKRESLMRDKFDTAKELLKSNPKKAKEICLKLVSELRQTYKNRDRLKYQLLRPLNLLANANTLTLCLNDALKLFDEVIEISDGLIDNIYISLLIQKATIMYLARNHNLAKRSLRKAFEKSKIIFGDTIESFKLRYKRMALQHQAINLFSLI